MWRAVETVDLLLSHFTLVKREAELRGLPPPRRRHHSPPAPQVRQLA